jgi:hypothetical protein
MAPTAAFLSDGTALNADDKAVAKALAIRRRKPTTVGSDGLRAPELTRMVYFGCRQGAERCQERGQGGLSLLVVAAQGRRVALAALSSHNPHIATLPSHSSHPFSLDFLRFAVYSLALGLPT